MSHRITKQHRDIIKKFQLTTMQESTLNSLLAAQERSPKLTTKQYELFLSIYKQIQRNKPVLNYG